MSIDLISVQKFFKNITVDFDVITAEILKITQQMNIASKEDLAMYIDLLDSICRIKYLLSIHDRYLTIKEIQTLYVAMQDYQYAYTTNEITYFQTIGRQLETLDCIKEIV